jgi:hypothetical protein
MGDTHETYQGADRRADRRQAADRRTQADRRAGFRGGRRLSDAARVGALTLSLFAAAGSAKGAEAPVKRAVATSTRSGPMRFGVDVDSVKELKAKGVDVSYGNFWVGPWTQKYGWGHTVDQLTIAKNQGVTPVINWWYWGDDISPRFVEQGGRDKYQGVHKDRATWIRMSTELAGHIYKTMGDRETIVVLETEFNKQGIETYEPFDAYLADVVRIFHRQGNIKVVIGFGNWGSQHWAQFDQAVAEADIVGTQLLQSSLRDKGTYLNSVNTVIAGTKTLHDLFHKPVLLIDFIVSSYPEPTYEANQAKVVRELFARLPELKAAGLEGLIWRSLKDDPKFDTANYHGVAERHWGLMRADGSFKTAYGTFVAGITQERSSGTPAN